MYISGDITDSFKDTWIPFTTSFDVTLTGIPGEKTVTIKFRNLLGYESDLATVRTHIEITKHDFTVVTNVFDPEQGQEALFRYSLSQQSRVVAKIFSISGECVTKLMDEERPSEIGVISWDGTNDRGRPVTSGIYLLNIETDNYKATEKVILERL